MDSAGCRSNRGNRNIRVKAAETFLRCGLSTTKASDSWLTRRSGLPALSGPGTVIRVTAITAFLAAATVVPAGIASAASGSTAPSNVAAPCLPVAADDTYSTPQDVTLTVGAPGVIENDESCGYNVQMISTTANGSLSLNADGSFEYTPNAGYVGADGFDYAYVVPIITFNGGQHPRGVAFTAHVDITVTPPPCAPVAVDDAYSTPQGVVLNVALPGVKVNDTHCDFFVHLFSNPDNGTLTLNADGTFQYTPNAGFSGIDSFEYALAEIMPGFAGGPRRGVSGWRAPQGAPDNVATVTITVTAPPPTTTSTTTTSTTTTTTTPTPTPTTTTTVPATTTTTVPAIGILPATR